MASVKALCVWAPHPPSHTPCPTFSHFHLSPPSLASAFQLSPTLRLSRFLTLLHLLSLSVPISLCLSIPQTFWFSFQTHFIPKRLQSFLLSNYSQHFFSVLKALLTPYRSYLSSYDVLKCLLWNNLFLLKWFLVLSTSDLTCCIFSYFLKCCPLKQVQRALCVRIIFNK